MASVSLRFATTTTTRAFSFLRQHPSSCCCLVASPRMRVQQNAPILLRTWASKSASLKKRPASKQQQSSSPRRKAGSSSGVKVLKKRVALSDKGGKAATNSNSIKKKPNKAATNSNAVKKKPNRNVSAGAGRVVVYQSNRSTKTAARQCVGCGSPIVVGGGRGGGEGTTTRMQTGEWESDELSLTKKQHQKTRFLDVTDIPKPGRKSLGKILCDRCKALQSNDVWKAYDALRDVEPKVFMDQLSFIVKRRKFGLCVLVLDATDSEHSVVRNLREAAIGAMPLVCVYNKVDLLPRFTWREQRTLDRKLNMGQLVASFAVSAKTGRGLVDLAEHLLTNLQGRDVFVVGSANVGKSTMVKALSELIAESNIYLKKGGAVKYETRRELASNLQVTGSHLPGTTLQAVRIPCFSSDKHALWDTPGILNPRAVQYNLFPAHLMEPLTRPERIPIPERGTERVVRLLPGQSLLITSGWMKTMQADYSDPDATVRTRNGKTRKEIEPETKNEDEECVLARMDYSPEPSGFSSSDQPIAAQAYLHPSLRVQVVPTMQAPDTATIPSGHISRVQQKIQQATNQSVTGWKDHYTLPLKPFVSPDRPRGEFGPSREDRSDSTGRFHMDIVFASLGWVALTGRDHFTVVPHCVQGSVFSKRRSLYPTNMSARATDDDDDDNNKGHYNEKDKGGSEEQLELARERIRQASKLGRLQKKRVQHRDRHDDDFDEDLF